MPGNTHHRVIRLGLPETRTVLIHIFIYRTREVIVRVDKPDILLSTEVGQDGTEDHALSLAISHQSVITEYIVVTRSLASLGQLRVFLVHHEHIFLGKLTNMLQGLFFYLKAVNTIALTIRYKNYQSVMGYSCQYTLDELNFFILDRDHNGHLLLNSLQ